MTNSETIINKTAGRELAHRHGFRYGGFADGLHMFHRELRNGYQNVLATDADARDGNADWMLANGFTRS